MLSFVFRVIIFLVIFRLVSKVVQYFLYRGLQNGHLHRRTGNQNQPNDFQTEDRKTLDKDKIVDASFKEID